MKYPNAHKHDFIALCGNEEFCDECGYPAAGHRIPDCDLIKRYVSKRDAKVTKGSSVGEIVKRKQDGKYFFNIREWNGQEWHPLTAGEQSGIFSDAQDRFESWKRMQEVWNNQVIQ